MAEHGLTEVREPDGAAASPCASPAAGAELALLSRLQTSLEPARLLDFYFEAVRGWLGLAGLSWRHGEQAVRLGRMGRCRHVYRLTLDDESLGELTAMRRTELSVQECLLLERSLGLLIHPLRNALLYRQAWAEARRDPLTRLGNRAALGECLRREQELSRRHRTAFSLVLLDIDHFKRINDENGHPAGDRVLETLAEVLRRTARASDLVFRYAGDEFVVVMSQTGAEGARVVARRLREAVAATPFEFDGRPLKVQISLGVAVAEAGETPASLFRRVDDALLLAKRSGRNCIEVAPPGEASFAAAGADQTSGARKPA